MKRPNADRVCAQLKASNAKYRARVRELEEALRALADAESIDRDWVAVRVLLSTTTLDTALQRALLEARIASLNEMTICMIDRRDKLVLLQQIGVLRDQLAALGEG